MKKVLSVLMITFMLFSTMMFPVSADNGEISVYLDAAKIEFDVQPQIINGRTLVPMRKIFEELGAVVDWDNTTQTAIGTKENIVVKFTINDYTMYKNESANTLDVPAQLIDGRTLIPLRAVSEAFECQVGWDGNTRTISIINDSEGYTLLYAPDGRVIEVPAGKVAENVAVGWSATPVEFGITESSENHTFGGGVLHVTGPSEIPYANNYKGKSNITTLYISGVVKSLGSFAFDDCINLSRIELSDSVTTLGDYAFDDTSITRIGIPKSVTHITQYTFDTNALASYSDAFNKNMVIYCEKGSVAEEYAKRYNLKYVYATMIYSIDGKTMMVDDEEKRIYLSSGLWNDRPLLQMYALDGRTMLVSFDQVEAYKAVGWYADKRDVLTTMYAPDGRHLQVYKAEVEAYKAVGWFENYSDVVVKMFSLDGRNQDVYKSNIASEQAVGWYLLDDCIAELINSYGFETALNFLDNMYSEHTYSWSEPNVIDASTYNAKYTEILNKYYKATGCPVIVLDWSRGSNSIGTPTINVTFRNLSQKTIVAYEHKFTCYDAYGNRTADYSWYNGNFTGYSTNENIKPGAKFYGSWTLYSNERTHTISWPYMLKVAFNDGSTWYR